MEPRGRAEQESTRAGRGDAVLDLPPISPVCAGHTVRALISNLNLKFAGKTLTPPDHPATGRLQSQAAMVFQTPTSQRGTCASATSSPRCSFSSISLASPLPRRYRAAAVSEQITETSNAACEYVIMGGSLLAKRHRPGPVVGLGVPLQIQDIIGWNDADNHPSVSRPWVP